MAEPFVLPPSKLSPPRLRRPVLERPRLTRSVADGLSRRLVVVSAEAGYGKTYLLASALAHREGPVAWLSLDETDTDPNLLAGGLVLALRRVAPGVGEAALQLLTTGPSAESVVATVLAVVDELSADTVLVLDDFHVLDDSPSAHAFVDGVLARAAPRLHVVLASRTRPPLRMLPRLLVEDDALVLGRDELAFRADEAHALLGQSFGLHVDAEQARELAERTEGWAAALSLVAAAAGRPALPAAGGTPREVFDYLAATVLADLPAPLQEFALRTSVLFEMTPALCAAVAEIAEAARYLTALEERNLFLYRLDDSGGRYRYHQLFAEFLRDRLSRREPGLAVELHRRAGRHLEAEGAGDQAVRHYLLAGAYGDAVRTLLPYRAARLTAQRAYLFRDLVRRLPHAVADQQPWLLRTAASSCRFIGDYEQALAWSRRAMVAADGRDADLWVHAAHGEVVMLYSMGRLGEAFAAVQDGLARVPAGVSPGLRGDLYQMRATIHRLRGDLRRSARDNETALRLAVPPHDLDGRGQALLTRGRIGLARLQPVAASAAFRAALDYAETRESVSYQSAAWTGLASALVAAGDAVAAAEALDRAQSLHARVGERTLELQLAVIDADLALLRSDIAVAGRHYHRAIAHCHEHELPSPKVLALLGLAQLSLLDRPADAARAVEFTREAIGRAMRAELGGVLPLARLVEAEALAAAGSAAEARRAVREAATVLTRWRSGPGLARCALLEARLLGAGAPRTLTHRAAALAIRHRRDLGGWLRKHASWIARLLAPLLARPGVETLLRGLGPAATEPLVDALRDPRTRLLAVRALGRFGDPGARRPLQQWSRRGDAVVRAAAAAALTAVGRPDPPALQAALLGRFEVRRDGRPIDETEWTTRKACALVKLLLLHRPGGLHEEQIVEWLWPDRDPARGFGSLKTAVKLARRALEPGLEGAASHFLRREGRTLRFEDAGVSVDLDEHARLGAAARAHVAAGRDDEAVADLERATALYRGDLLDPEDRYEPWAEAARERWRAAQVGLLVDLSRLRASRAEYEQAAASMRAAVTLDPARESAYRELIQYALLRGQRAEALATYRECVQALEREIGATPEPETRRLLEAVRALS